MFVCCWLALLAFVPATSGVDPGVQVRLTEKGLEYGRQLGMASIQERLKSIKVPDFSGKRGRRTRYYLYGMRIVDVGLPKSDVDLVQGTGVRLSIGNAFIRLKGSWKVKYWFLRLRGGFDLSVSGVSIATSLSIKKDSSGRPEVSSVGCRAVVGRANIRFSRGLSWLYNLFRRYIGKLLRRAMEKQICPLVNDAISGLNPELKTLNVLAKVDKHAEIEYAMVSSPTVRDSYIDFNLKGEFYRIGNRQEPPFSPVPFSLPPGASRMVYIGVSAFTTNSAASVYHRAGALSLDITDSMLPRGSSVRLNTREFGAFIPQLVELFPDLGIKLQVKTAQAPVITFKPNNMTIQASAAVTAQALQHNGTLSSLFVLNLETSISARVFVSGTRLAAAVTLNKVSVSLGKSSCGEFQVDFLDKILQKVLELVVIPKVNVQLAKGYPLPTLGKMKLLNTQLQILKDYMLIGTDVQFTG